MEKLQTPRKRVELSLNHQQPDRTPVDFLAVPEIWEALIENQGITSTGPDSSFYDPRWENLLKALEVDCRVISYDQFPSPPEQMLDQGSSVAWYSSLGRSTPNRMWRQINPNGEIKDIWGRVFQVKENPFGAYEEISRYPLDNIQSSADCENHAWPDPDWWDFSGVLDLLAQLDQDQEYHLRYRLGSVFEVAWQLRGMDKFLLDMAIDPQIPTAIMKRLTETYLEITARFLEAAGDRIDMVYFYDDVATQESLLISGAMWQEQIQPHHQKLVDLCKKHDLKVMYHCDGAIYPLLPNLIEMGIDVLNPVQADAKNMEPQRLKSEFGDKLAFHGGIDIIDTLPKGTPSQVQEEVKSRISTLGKGGGYIMASSHHIQGDTPLDNIYAMYDINIR
jgi:uroporphyrinogen decarboxylase